MSVEEGKKVRHTREPWEVTNSGHGGIGMIEGDNHSFVAEVGGRTAQEIMANTSRIVACVNACAGITNEALANGIVMGCIEIARIVNDPEVKKDSELRWMGVQVFEEDV